MLENENRNFEKFDVTEDVLGKFQILILPENFEEAKSRDELFDATDAIQLAKRLKEEDIHCANSLDLNLNPKILERRSEELWFGLIYIIDYIAMPFFINVLASLVVNAYKDRDQKVIYKNKASKVHLKLKLKKPSGFTTIKYDGDPKTLIKVLEGLNNNQE